MATPIVTDQARRGEPVVTAAAGGARGPFVIATLHRVSDSYQYGFALMTRLVASALAAAMLLRMPRQAVT